MNSSKKSSKIALAILVFVIIVAVVFLIFDLVDQSTGVGVTTSSSLNDRLQASSTQTTGQSSSTSPISSIDTSSWKTFSDAQTPFSIRYPADLTVSTSVIPTIDGPYLLALQFPKSIYFTTVLADEAYVIVTASSTCLAVAPGPIDNAPQAFNENGMAFIENQVSDVGAGNRYLTITYDTLANGLCYRITLFDHGANGAGLYLSDPAAIKTADDIHSAELSKVEAIIGAMVGTFSSGASQ